MGLARGCHTMARTWMSIFLILLWPISCDVNSMSCLLLLSVSSFRRCVENLPSCSASVRSTYRA